jgi:hypothetical protein
MSAVHTHPQLRVITDMQAMYRVKDAVLRAAKYGRWSERFDMDASKGVTPDACRNLALFVAKQKHPDSSCEVQYRYSFQGDQVMFFIDIYFT